MNKNELIARAALEEWHRSGHTRGASDESVTDMGYFAGQPEVHGTEVHEKSTLDYEREQREQNFAESLGPIVCGDCGVTVDEGCSHMVPGGGTRG